MYLIWRIYKEPVQVIFKNILTEELNLINLNHTLGVHRFYLHATSTHTKGK